MSRHRFTHSGFGRLEEPLDLWLVADVAVGVGVELHVQAVLVEDPPAQLVGLVGQQLPLLVGQRRRLSTRPPVLWSPPHARDHHDVLAADGLGQRGDVGHLLPDVVP